MVSEEPKLSSRRRAALRGAPCSRALVSQAAMPRRRLGMPARREQVVELREGRRPPTGCAAESRGGVGHHEGPVANGASARAAAGDLDPNEPLMMTMMMMMI